MAEKSQPLTCGSKISDSQHEKDSFKFLDDSSIATVKYSNIVVQTDEPMPAPVDERYEPKNVLIYDEHPAKLARVITQGIQRLTEALTTHYEGEEKGQRKQETGKAARTRRVYAQSEPFAELRPPPPRPNSFVVMLRETPTFFLLDEPCRSAERRTKEGIQIWVLNKRHLLGKRVNLEAFQSGKYSSEDPDDVHESDLAEQYKESRSTRQGKTVQEKVVERVSTTAEDAEHPPSTGLDGEEVDIVENASVNIDQSTEDKAQGQISCLFGEDTDKVRESLKEIRGLEDDVALEEPEEEKSESKYEDREEYEAGKREEIEEPEVEEREEGKSQKQVEESKEDKPEDQVKDSERSEGLPRYKYQYEYIARRQILIESRPTAQETEDDILITLPEEEFIKKNTGVVLPIVWGPTHVEEPAKEEAQAKEIEAAEDKDKTTKETGEEEEEEEEEEEDLLLLLLQQQQQQQEEKEDDKESDNEDLGLGALERSILGGKCIDTSENAHEKQRLLTDSELKVGPLWKRKYLPLRKRFHGNILETEEKEKVEQEESESREKEEDESEEEEGEDFLEEEEIGKEDREGKEVEATEKEITSLDESEKDKIQEEQDRLEQEEIRQNWQKLRRIVLKRLGINRRYDPGDTSSSSEASSSLSLESIAEPTHSVSNVKPVSFVDTGSVEWEAQFWQPCYDFVGNPKCVATQVYNDDCLKRCKSISTYMPTAKKRDASTFVDVYDLFITFKRLVTYERKMSRTREGIVVLKTPSEIPTDMEGLETFQDIVSLLYPPPSNEEKFRALEKTDAFQNALTLMERILASNGYGKQQKKFRGLISETYYTDKITYTLELLWTSVTDSVRGKCVTGMCWNFKNDNILAIGYGKYFYEEESRGKVCCWTIKNPVHPERIYDFYAPVTSLEFSKEHPNLLAVGLYNGCLLVVDVSCKTKRIVAQNYEENSTLEDSIWQVNWFIDDFGEECLMTCTQGGNIHRYQRDKKLHCSLLLKLSNVEGNISGIPLPQKWVSRSVPSTHSPGALVFAKPILESKIYYVGTNEGGIHKCSQVHLKQHLDVFLAHLGPVYGIQFSPFCNRIFLTCGGDWRIRIWAEGINDPLVTLKTKQRPVLGAVWSPKNATIIASICDQEINVWDIRRQITSPAFSLLSPTKTPNSTIQFSRCGRNLIVGDRKGNVNVFSLNDMPHDPYFQTAALGQGLKKSVGKYPDKMKVLRGIEGLFPEGK